MKDVKRFAEGLEGLLGERPAMPPAQAVFPSERLREAAAAAERGDVATLRALVARGADLDEVAPSDVTLLMYEIVAKNETAVRALLAAGANPNVLTNIGTSPMLVAATSPDPRFLVLLLDNGGDPNLENQKGVPLAHQALNFGQWQNLGILFDHGVPVDVKNKMEQTPALRLAYLNRYDEVHKLLDRGADADAKDQVGLSVRKLAEKPIPAADSPLEGWRRKVAERLGIPVDQGGAAPR
ncbi:ankyrin repeat domain-containing protein [Polyangium sp. y55x31]|uniref:ankyrin repeat domain-containing protein n=1 Tax=Polyangium sp. y55x31 TaxID=3042688 RepID=UPI002482DF27|nr:ankyrin repeat domain-containing protein [Polyangium sp. y55x31]